MSSIKKSYILNLKTATALIDTKNKRYKINNPTSYNMKFKLKTFSMPDGAKFITVPAPTEIDPQATTTKLVGMANIVTAIDGCPFADKFEQTDGPVQLELPSDKTADQIQALLPSIVADWVAATYPDTV